MNQMKRYIVALVVSIFIVTMTHNVHAQSDEDLEEENQKLIEENKTLKETIASLEEQIAALETKIEELTQHKTDENTDAITDQLYSIGEEAELNGVAVRVEDAYFTDERNMFLETENEVILIDVYFENNTGEPYDPTLDFRVVYGDEFAMQYPLGDVTFEILEDGESNTVTLVYEIHGEPERIELQYGSEIMVFNNDETIIFDVTPQ